VYISILFCWVFSILLSLPLVFGSNAETRLFLIEKHHCGIYNPTYMFVKFFENYSKNIF